jgi:serine/threonine-protein kinase
VLALASPGSVALAAAPAATKAATPVKAAEAVASAWLPLIDTAQWVPAWNATGSYLRATVGEAKWLTSIAQVRAITGALVSRRLKSAYETTYLPGAPYGHYVVVYYASRFAHRSPASETLTLMEDSAGAWRVVGYYLK